MSKPSGFDLSDLIQIWIGLAVSISAIFAWLTYRIAKGGFFLSLPHVYSRVDDGPSANLVWITLLGPNTELWEIASVSILSPRQVHFLQRKDEQDDYGSPIWKIGDAIGRTQTYRSSPLVLSSLATPVRLRVKLSLKALPSVISWRTTTINKSD